MSRLPNSEEAQTMDFLVIWYRPFLWERLKQKDTLENHQKQEQDIIFALEDYRTSHPKDFKMFSKKVEKFKSLTQSVNILPQVFSRPPMTMQKNLLWIILLIMLVPITLYGLLNNLPAGLFLKFFYNKKVKDQNLSKSVKLRNEILLFTVFYIIQTGLVGYIFGEWWIALLYLISLPISGFLALFVKLMADRLIDQYEYRQFLKDPNNEFMVQYREIVLMMDSVVKGWAGA